MDKILAEAEKDFENVFNMYKVIEETCPGYQIEFFSAKRFLSRALTKALTQQRQELEAEREKWLESILPEKEKLGDMIFDWDAFPNSDKIAEEILDQIKQNAKKI